MERLFGRKIILAGFFQSQVKILSAQIHWMRKSRFSPDEPRKVCIDLDYAANDPLNPSKNSLKNLTIVADRRALKEAFKLAGNNTFFVLTCTILGTGEEATVNIPRLLSIGKFVEKIK